MKRVYPNREVCIGCHLCELAVLLHIQNLVISYSLLLKNVFKTDCLRVKKYLKKIQNALLSAVVIVMILPALLLYFQGHCIKIRKTVKQYTIETNVWVVGLALWLVRMEPFAGTPKKIK